MNSSDSNRIQVSLDKRFYTGLIIAIVITLIIGVACIWYLVDKSNKNKHKVMTNIPSESWFEEDLEEQLLTKEITVYQRWRDIDTLRVFAIASYDGNIYRYCCQYQLKNYMVTCWYWEYVRAVRI